MTELSLPSRGLDGILPVGLGSLPALTTLDLSGNSLTGQIPAELNNLANLTRWRLAGNSLSGCVPSTFAQVSDNDIVESESANVRRGESHTHAGPDRYADARAPGRRLPLPRPRKRCPATPMTG